MKPLLAMALWLAACDTSMDPSPRPTVHAVLNVPFTLAAGQSAILDDEDLSVTFVRVLDDSRCPLDATCIQAGDATMSVRAELQGRGATILNLTLFGGTNAVYEGFGFHAQQLLPGQLTGRTIPPGDYSVRLLVDRP
jgi:hypothetical protein